MGTGCKEYTPKNETLVGRRWVEGRVSEAHDVGWSWERGPREEDGSTAFQGA